MNNNAVENMSVMLREKIKSSNMLSRLADSINSFFNEKSRMSLLILDLSDQIAKESNEEVKKIKKRSLKLHQDLLENNKNAFEEQCVSLADILKKYAEVVFEDEDYIVEKENFIAFYLEYGHISESVKLAFEETLAVYYNVKTIKQGVFEFEILYEDRDFLAEAENLKELLSVMLAGYLNDTFKIVIKEE